jgi:hypothetical protein
MVRYTVMVEASWSSDGRGVALRGYAAPEHRVEEASLLGVPISIVREI